jgi:hypothetical protein
MDQNVGPVGAWRREGEGAADRNLRDAADQEFALNPQRREEAVFGGDPTAAHSHAAGDQTQEFREFTAGHMFSFHALDWEINFGRGPIRE